MPSKIAHISTAKLERASEVLTAVVFLNNLSTASLPPKDTVEFACTILESMLPDLEEESHKKLTFLMEQLQLVLKGPKQRRYSSFILTTAMMWQMTSPALYNQILSETVLTLPSVRYLKRLSSALAVSAGLSDETLQYLKVRASSLGPREKNVTIIIDEVYSAKRVEFTGGKLYGLENDDVSKTLLCFMVKSVAGNYRDMVAMLPISKVDAVLIEKHFQAVLKSVTEVGLEVVCVSTDGHSANRKFFEMLSGGKIAPFFTHPHDSNKRIYLLFDPVHLFKNF